MKTILVTGGAGFIGSNLCEELVKNPKNRVISIDNYSTGSKQNHIEGVEYYDMDTRHILSLRTHSPDLIYHFGEYSRVEQSFSDFDKVWDYNVNGTKAVLEFARINESKLIYAGSSTKFGDNGANSSPYAWSKSNNTTLVQNYSDWYKLNYAIVYFYNNFGEREISHGTYATVIGKFLEKMKMGESVEITSPGTQLRNFTYVKDTVKALISVGMYGNGDGYCIGNPETYSILDIANILGLKYSIMGEHRGNRMTAGLNLEKIHEFGWTPTLSLREYLEKEKLKLSSPI